jgi:hypothetical protein
VLADALDLCDELDRFPFLLLLDLLLVFLRLLLEFLNDGVSDLLLSFVVETERKAALSVVSALLAERLFLLCVIIK